MADVSQRPPADVTHASDGQDASSMESEVRSMKIKDNQGGDVQVVWFPEPLGSAYHKNLPPFPIHVYFTPKAATIATDSSFPASLVYHIRRLGNFGDDWRTSESTECNYHLELYLHPLPNVLSCVAHQRTELRYRNENGIVTFTFTGSHYRTKSCRIVVVDSTNWTEGNLVWVAFDLREHATPLSDEVRDSRDEDVCTVRAVRSRSWPCALHHLRELWSTGGGAEAVQSLARWNDGGMSMQLEPEAVLDIDEEHDSESTASEEQINMADPHDALEALNKADRARMASLFDMTELLIPKPLEHTRYATYSDVTGRPVTSVWDPRLSRENPPFSITLYISSDSMHLHPNALFHALNKGMLECQAWTLDIIQGITNAAAAYQYHAQSSSRRRADATMLRRRCTRMILTKVNEHRSPKISDNRLPKELMDYIEDLLVPPEVPTYSSLPRRFFPDMFLFLDPAHLLTGPQLVYFDQDERSAGTQQAQAGLSSAERSSPPLRGNNSEEAFVLLVDSPHYWCRVTNEIWTLWTLCSPRSTDRDMATLPSVDVRIVKGAPDGLILEFVLHGNRPVTIGMEPALSHPSHERTFTLTDLATGDVIAEKSRQFYPSRPTTWQVDWQQVQTGISQASQTGLPEQHGLAQFWAHLLSQHGVKGLEKANHFETLWPQVPRVFLSVDGYWKRLPDYYAFVDGRRYRLTMRPDVVIPMWTFGKVGALEGLFNMPPLQVTSNTSMDFVLRRQNNGESAIELC
ncbi:hypothetical protein LTR09_010170 [Extremus antarcticus]|uniref:Uncharacterized protein n=1 Tax=Extremus antarcticus TaxID=702011 RepID=A0AAJ0D820_9PEZI|nr:hypothetical protein LTR09_010170 [Extremus antarcticus]